MIKLKDILTEEKADKDYDGDGKIESPEDEYMGSRDKAIKQAKQGKKEESIKEAEQTLQQWTDTHEKQGHKITKDNKTATYHAWNGTKHVDSYQAHRKFTKEEHGPETELKIGDYQTKHYHMCPGAKTLYQDIEGKVEDMDLAVRTAKLQDALFALEMRALENGAVEADVDAAELIADQIMAMARMLGLEKEHSYIQGHVDKIKAAVK